MKKLVSIILESILKEVLYIMGHREVKLYLKTII